MKHRYLSVVAACLLFGVAVASPVSAHGADADPSSNYRTRITAITPAIDGLTARVVDTGGRISVTNRTGREIVILGYQDEPYLRITDEGVFENAVSPATYLNSTRDGLAPIPPEADAKAAPVWRKIAVSRTVAWHDHRAHWMSPVPPPAVQANPGSTFVIYDEWSIPLTVGGQLATITGDLTWVPAPSRTAALVVALAIFIVFAIAMQSRFGRSLAIVVASVGWIVDGVATLGYYQRSSETLSNRLWSLMFTALLGVAVLMLVVQRRRGCARPPLSLLVAGLLLLLMGGVDHMEVLSNSQIPFALPAAMARIAVVAELGLGAALVTTFAVAFVSVSGASTRAARPEGLQA